MTQLKVNPGNAYPAGLDTSREYTDEDLDVWAVDLVAYMKNNKGALFWEEWLEEADTMITRETIVNGAVHHANLQLALVLVMDMATTRIAKLALNNKLNGPFAKYVLSCQGYLRERPAELKHTHTSTDSMELIPDFGEDDYVVE